MDQIWSTGRGTTVISCFKKNSYKVRNMWAGALSWCSIQVLFLHPSGLFLRSASLKHFITPTKTVHWLSDNMEQTQDEWHPSHKKKKINTFTFDQLWHASFGCDEISPPIATLKSFANFKQTGYSSRLSQFQLANTAKDTGGSLYHM
jgi:hypothetical protein